MKRDLTRSKDFEKFLGKRRRKSLVLIDVDCMYLTSLQAYFPRREQSPCGRWTDLSFRVLLSIPHGRMESIFSLGLGPFPGG